MNIPEYRNFYDSYVLRTETFTDRLKSGWPSLVTMGAMALTGRIQSGSISLPSLRRVNVGQIQRGLSDAMLAESTISSEARSRSLATKAENGGSSGINAWSVKPYTGDEFSPDFVGPVKFETFFRGDAVQRRKFLSSMAETSSVDETQSYLGSLADDMWALRAKNHSYYNDGSPFISVSKNRTVAEYFARGEGQDQAGWVTEFRVPSGNQAKEFKYNFHSEFNAPGVNVKLGLPEQEYLAPGHIDRRYIYKQYQVFPK